jgi:hypothetical protein
MKTMILLPVTRLFIDRITGNPISKSKYATMMHKKMQKWEYQPSLQLIH